MPGPTPQGAPQGGTPQAQGGSPAQQGGPSGGGIKSPSTPKSPTETLEENVIEVGKGNKWAKDLKSATRTKADDKIKKDNPDIVDEYPIGEAFSEKAENVADLLIVDIDNLTAGRTIVSLAGATAPLYGVALTKKTIEAIVDEGFLVTKTNTDKRFTIENGALVIPS